MTIEIPMPLLIVGCIVGGLVLVEVVFGFLYGSN